MDTYDLETLIIVNGSGNICCGFGGDEMPRALFPTIYGNPKNVGIMVGGEFKYDYIGDEAVAKRGILNVRRSIPIDGSPMNFNYLERTWNHTFYNELRVTPEEHQVIMTDLPNMDGAYKRISEILFETFNVISLELANPSVLSIYAHGFETGCVVDSGFGGTRIVPVYEGYPIIPATMRMEAFEEKEDRVMGFKYKRPIGIGGDLIKRHLIDLAYEREWEMTTTGERNLMTDVKEKLCYFSMDYTNDMLRFEKEKKEVEKTYVLPDGTEMVLGSQYFRACEILFKPHILDLGRLSCLYGDVRKDNKEERKREHGVHEYIEESIKRCSDDKDFQDLMYNRIALTGGNTMITNFEKRLEMEMRSMLNNRPLKIHSPSSRDPDCKISVESYLGGSILSQLQSHYHNFAKNEYFKEVGKDRIQWSGVWARSFLFPESSSSSSRMFFSSLDSMDPDLPERVEFVKKEFEGKFEIMVKNRRSVRDISKIFLLL